MKNYIKSKRLILIIFAILYKSSSLCFAASETFTNQVTVEVPSYLFIEGDRKDLNLTFMGYQAGSETNTQMIVYTVMANSLGQTDGAPVVTAKLGGIFPNMDFRARVGAYTKEGGNAELGALSSDFITVGESETVLARKTNSTGDGKVLRGQIEVSYKAVAASSLKAGSYSQPLSVTLTDV